MTIKLMKTSSFPVIVQTQKTPQTSWIEGLESVGESLGACMAVNKAQSSLNQRAQLSVMIHLLV